MARKRIKTLTNAEHRIMEVIWARGSATVADVVEALEGKDAYTTILTLMRILKAKGPGVCFCAEGGSQHGGPQSRAPASVEILFGVPQRAGAEFSAGGGIDG